MALPVMKPHALCSAFQPSNSKINHNPLPRALGHLGQCRWSSHSLDLEKRVRGSLARHLNALPDFPLMAVMVQHVEGTRDWIVHKSIWHLSDASIKNVYIFYFMFTVWGCCFFASMNDPYDRDDYRSQGGDGTAHWWYDKQEDIEQANRAELYREELIEEIEQKVGALREIEEAIGKEEQLVK
ncbi:NDH dependent flow 6 [Carex rostrata]